MQTVYILRSIHFPDQYYVGLTADLDHRMTQHNSGESKHTKRYRPWKLLVCITFDDTEAAKKFEGFLKTGTGRSFAKKHFRVSAGFLKI